MQAKATAVSLLFATSGLLVALAASWLVLAQLNFSYGFWHDHGGIAPAIERFGPTNDYRHGFHMTTREQRIELFAGINRAIHRNGRGLAELRFEVPGHAPQLLLREPEVVHLEDVADLIQVGRYAAFGALVIWLSVIGVSAFYRQPLPSLQRQMLGLAGLVVVGTAVVLLVGPVKVFYAMHDWFFPPDNQWFFYYNESLMATMMYAPVLFGWIAMQWVIMAVLAFGLLQWGAARAVVSLRAQVPFVLGGADKAASNPASAAAEAPKPRKKPRRKS